VSIDDDLRRKREAIDAHSSQAKLGRLLVDQLTELERRFAQGRGATQVEAFSVLQQEGAGTARTIVARLTCCPFTQFWTEVLGERSITIIHAVPILRQQTPNYRWAVDRDRDGIAQLRSCFDTLMVGGPRVEELSCRTPDIESVLRKGHVLLSGGAASNSITRDHFNHYPGLRYVIDFDMPNYHNIRILDRNGYVRIHPKYEQDQLGNTRPSTDFGILTIMANPECRGSRLIGAMGIHGLGSRAVFTVLSSPAPLRELTATVSRIAPDHGLQVLVRTDVRRDVSEIMWDTLHLIEPAVAVG
jgi:hypothetical protein